MDFKKLCSHPLLGANAALFLRLLFQNGLQIRFRKLFKIIYVLMSTLVFSAIAAFESRLLRNKLPGYKLSKDPVFIIGHWRSGTTFLHYLLSKDEQFGYLDNGRAFMPGNMLIAQNLVRWLVRIHLFPKRPMDDIRLTANCAQEEEIAVSNLGRGAYLGWYFPEKFRYFFSKYMLFENCTDEEKNEFKTIYKNLILKTSLANDGKPLILKNPVNTTRIGLLLELFPKAKFIYLYRDPYDVYYSTVKLHTKMMKRFAFQPFRVDEIEEMVMHFYPKIIRNYEKAKSLIPEGHLLELDYDFLIKHPLQTLETVYRTFKMAGFEQAKPEFEKYLKSQSGYKAASYERKPERIRLIDLFWKANITKYRASPMSVN